MKFKAFLRFAHDKEPTWIYDYTADNIRMEIKVICSKWTKDRFKCEIIPEGKDIPDSVIIKTAFLIFTLDYFGEVKNDTMLANYIFDGVQCEP